MEALYEHREFFATGVDFDHGGVEQNRRGGGAGPGGCFSSLTVRKETDRKNKWRVFLVRTIARVLFYEYIP